MRVPDYSKRILDNTRATGYEYLIISPDDPIFLAWADSIRIFRTMQGIENLSNEAAEKLIGPDRESAQRDLFSTIARGDYPKWQFSVQIMPEAEADQTPYNPFDLTKVWPHRDYQTRIVIGSA